MLARPKIGEQPPSPPDHWPVLEACTDACAGFKRLPQEGWSDYGLCINPLSPHHGAPVLIGRDCLYAVHLIHPSPSPFPGFPPTIG